MTKKELLTGLIGKGIFIRSVTFHYVGILQDVVFKENGEVDSISLIKASWIADSGRFSEAIKNKKFQEVEPYPDTIPVYLNTDAWVDFIPWDEKTLPMKAT